MKQRAMRLYNWALLKAESPKAPLWIGLLFFFEILLFIPLDAILMFFCLQKRSNTFLYIVLATLASTISGVVGYLLGHFLWDLVGPYIVPHLVSAAHFANISSHFQAYEHWAVLIGGLIPFPLKALSIAAGVFQLGVWPFAIYLALARLIRFSIIGGSMAFWGDKIKPFIDRHFHRILVLVGAKIAFAFFFFWALAN